MINIAAHATTLAELTRQSRDISAALKKTKAKCRRQAKKITKIREDTLSQGLGILALCAPDESYLLHVCGTVAETPEDAAVLKDCIVDKFLTQDTDDLIKLVSPNCANEIKAYEKAVRYKVNHDVKNWIETCNAQKGLAPTPKDTILQRLKYLKEESRRSGFDLLRNGGGKWGPYRWLLRFKKKWQVKKGQPGTLDLDPLEIRRKKVGREKTSMCFNPAPLARPTQTVVFGGAENGTSFGATKGAHYR